MSCDDDNSGTRLLEITTLEGISTLLPKLKTQFPDLVGKWDAEQTADGFILESFTGFMNKNFKVYAELRGDDILYCFIADLRGKTAIFTLFFINPIIRQDSEKLANLALDNLRALGHNKAKLATTRLTKSYSRWMGKLGFEPSKLQYERTL